MKCQSRSDKRKVAGRVDGAECTADGRSRIKCPYENVPLARCRAAAPTRVINGEWTVSAPPPLPGCLEILGCVFFGFALLPHPVEAHKGSWSGKVLNFRASGAQETDHWSRMVQHCDRHGRKTSTSASVVVKDQQRHWLLHVWKQRTTFSGRDMCNSFLSVQSKLDPS